MYSIDNNDKKDFEELKLKIYNEVKSFIESHPNVESYIKRYIELYSSTNLLSLISSAISN